MVDVTVIGRGANIVGTVSGAVDLTIHGRVEGEVSALGEVTIESEALVAASVTGRRVVVRGAVKGDVTAEDGIRLEEGARVVGDLRAPRVAVTRGALVRGHVQTSPGRGEDSKPHTAKAARPARVESPAATPARKAAPPTLLAGGAPRPKGPPPPVVPALRKGAKGSFKKRAG